MITLRHSNERGHANYGWLDTKHSFSFGDYYDPEHMGVSVLRVINDDQIEPNSGFDTHGHRDMEILTYVIEGAIEHKDSQGNRQILNAGEFQLMSAGSGIYHSEYNPSQTQTLRLLQIWIKPNRFGEQPGYQQKAFGKQSGFTSIVTPEGLDGTLSIKQDARLYQLILEPNSNAKIDTDFDRKLYVHHVSGEQLHVNNVLLHAGDGAQLDAQSDVEFVNKSSEPIVALVFDLP
ncbi:pirin family protein [Vibrio marisflavi]|uniref:Quercetin 2,3-dioxygenase n=1 Tax=Vibrio marisflavi CECT 7928 TaxID=634439 RepID=A0ABN8E1M7_9VIBR|nr:pirin-like bicupin family protein [Vibrio marisflavi]CAH0538845.1 Quercetin 2,3-dioxygenase [Vibrio marisflavi CECT 7928]